MAYGVYGFGGGAYEAPASGLLRGVQAGVGLFRDAEADRRAQEALDLHKQQAQQQMAHQDAQEQRLSAESQRKVDKDTHDELFKNLTASKDEMAGLMQQYGGDAKNIPNDQRAAAVSKVSEANNLYNAHVRKQAAPLIKQFNDHVQQVSSDLASGRVQPEDVDSDVFYKAIVGATHRPVQDLVSQNGQPSLVQQAHDNIVAGLDGKNMHQLYEGLDQFFAPELGKIKGKSTPMGVAQSAQFLRLDPAPGTNDRVMPTLLVKTDLHPEGYAAPISEFRSGDKSNDPNIQTFKIDDIMERMGKTVMLSQYLSSPEGQKKLSDASPEAQADVDKFLAFLPHSTKDFKTQIVDFKDRKAAVTTGPGGKVVSNEDLGKTGTDPNIEARMQGLETRQSVREAGLNARAANAESGRTSRSIAPDRRTQSRLDAIDDMVESGELTPEESKQEKLNVVRGQPKSGGLPKPMTQGEANLKIESIAGQQGLRNSLGEWQQLDPKTQRWGTIKADGQATLSKIRSQVAGEMEKSRGRGLTPAAPTEKPTTPEVAPLGAVKISSDADYNKLPSGATYIAPDGSTRKKK